MWDDAKQARLDALREQEELGALPTAEEQELASLYAELDAEEAECLRPTAERMDEDAAVLRAQNDQLAAIVEERRQLRERMRSQIARWLKQHERLSAQAGALVLSGRSG